MLYCFFLDDRLIGNTYIDYDDVYSIANENYKLDHMDLTWAGINVRDGLIFKNAIFNNDDAKRKAIASYFLEQCSGRDIFVWSQSTLVEYTSYFTDFLNEINMEYSFVKISLDFKEVNINDRVETMIICEKEDLYNKLLDNFVLNLNRDKVKSKFINC